MRLQSITNTHLLVYSTLAVAGGWTGYTIHRALYTLNRLERDTFERGRNGRTN